jgi:hypothetical protein
MTAASTTPPAVATTTAPGGNVYVGPSLASSLLRFAAALVTAQPEPTSQR